MRFHALMPIRNECHRYLQSNIVWHRGSFDSFFIYDDNSDDEASEVITPWRDITYYRRGDESVAFLEHEGMFRLGMYKAWEKIIEPHPGDWVFALDADEFLVGPASLAQTLHVLAEAADTQGSISFQIQIPEVWSLLYPPRVRIDGFWGNLWAPRFFRYFPPITMSDKAMGGGCWPSYVNPMHSTKTNLLYILHYGYAFEADREDKFIRYTNKGDHGHNNAHIQSIKAKPTLSTWTGESPRVWRGVID